MSVLFHTDHDSVSDGQQVAKVRDQPVAGAVVAGLDHLHLRQLPPLRSHSMPSSYQTHTNLAVT